MYLLKKHKNKLMTVGFTLVAIAGIKFAARNFSNVPVVGGLLARAAQFL